MQTATIEATWRGIDGRAQEGWYDVRLTHRLVNATGETILPAGRIAAGRLSEREDEPSLTLAVPAADVDDTAEWFLVVYIIFEERRTSETYVLEPVAPGEVIDLTLQVPVVGVPEGLGGGTVVRGIDGKDGRGIVSVELDGDTLVFTYDDDTVEIVTVEGGFGGGDVEPGAPGRGIESLTQVDETTLVVTFTDETTQTLTLPRGADGHDADPLTITEQRETAAGDVVLTFSDGSEVTIPGGRDAAPLTVDGYTFDEGGHTVVTFSDGSEAVVQRGADGEDGDDADALTVTGSTVTAAGVLVVFSDGSEVVVPRGPAGEDGATPHVGPGGNWWVGDTDTGTPARGADGEDGADFTFADFTPEQLEALRGPRGYSGRGVESITDEDGDGVATVTYSDGETAELPLPAGGGGGGGFDIDEAGPVMYEHLDPLFREYMLDYLQAPENVVNSALINLAWMAEDYSPAFASFMLPAALAEMMQNASWHYATGSTRGWVTPSSSMPRLKVRGEFWQQRKDYIKVTLNNVGDTDHEVVVNFVDGESFTVTVPTGGEFSEIYQASGGYMTLEMADGSRGTSIYNVEVFS